MNPVAVLALQEAQERSPILEVINHLSPHRYGWAPHWEIAGIDFTISNAVFNIVLASALVIAVFWAAASKPRIVPKGIQNLIEAAIDWVKDQIVYSVMAPGDALKWAPFIVTIFFFILFLNAVGLIPLIGFTPTSNIFVTGALAVDVWLLAVAVGMARHGPLTFWKKTLVPPDIPKALIPLMVLIDMISQLARPFSLAVRLFANMMADHVILLIFVGFIFLVGGGAFALGHIIIIPVSMVFEVIFTAFALFVAFIQAVIFAYLSTIYINEALHPGH